MVLFAVINRPPKYNEDFISDFSELMAEFLSKYYRVLAVGDFNIHICCPEDPIPANFLNVIDSFNPVSGPTHELGHMLDLVLSHGLRVSNLDICDAVST